jgi:hypothetical protein
MSGRSLDDFNHERQALDAAHAQNEAGRDAFIALAHTALFAASVSFVGDVAPITEAIWRPALVLGWLAAVVGLLALSFSFGAARRAIDARRAALNDADPPNDRICELLNATALWSFPVALLCLFSFVTANVVHADVRQAKPSATTELRETRGKPAPASADARRHIEPRERSDPSPTRASGTPAATAALKEVTTNAAQPVQRKQ